MCPTDGDLRRNSGGGAEIYRDPPGKWEPYTPYRRPDAERAPDPEEEFPE